MQTSPHTKFVKPIIEDGKIGVNIDDKVEIIVDLSGNTVTEEIAGVSLGTQTFDFWSSCFSSVSSFCCKCKK